jgi:hypothetical protein
MRFQEAEVWRSRDSLCMGNVFGEWDSVWEAPRGRLCESESREACVCVVGKGCRGKERKKIEGKKILGLNTYPESLRSTVHNFNNSVREAIVRSESLRLFA